MSKVTVMKDVCIGCGLCTTIAGDVFAIGDDGLAEVISDTLNDSIDEAAASCPVQAIVVE
jgi:ferredoxin